MEYKINSKAINFEQPLIMAIVNLTPDSLYDGGKFDSLTDVLADVELKLKAGSDIIDIGAASSRPGSKEISEEEEWRRLEEPLKQIRNKFPQAIISVDTYRSSIAQKAVALGADIINDISGGEKDGQMFSTIVELNVPYILMHMKGEPETMQNDPSYSDIIKEVTLYFDQKIKHLSSRGFSKIIIDPGFGFGKTTEHNYQLLKGFDTLLSLGCPILAGVSRKSMINKVINTNPVTALNGTTVVNTIALLNGASILRVHDVVEAKQAVKLVQFYKNA